MFKVGDKFTHKEYPGRVFIVVGKSHESIYAEDVRYPGEPLRNFYKLHLMQLVKSVNYLNKEAVCTK